MIAIWRRQDGLFGLVRRKEVSFAISLLQLGSVGFSRICRVRIGVRVSVRIRVSLVFSEREVTFTFAICCRPSACLSVVCNARAP